MPILISPVQFISSLSNRFDFKNKIDPKRQKLYHRKEIKKTAHDGRG